MGSFVAAALARARAFLVEPPSAKRRVAVPAMASHRDRLQVTVLGLTPGCGATTVARALAAALGARMAIAGQDDDVHACEPRRTVWDVSPGEFEYQGRIAAKSQAVVLVADERSEPSVAAVVSAMLSERFGPVLLVANRIEDQLRWSDRADVCFSESRLGAALVGRRRWPVGPLAGAAAELAALIETRLLGADESENLHTSVRLS